MNPPKFDKIEPAVLYNLKEHYAAWMIYVSHIILYSWKERVMGIKGGKNLDYLSISDLLHLILCHHQSLQVAARVRRSCCDWIQRQKEVWSSTPHLLHLWQCLPVHAHWSAIQHLYLSECAALKSTWNQNWPGFRKTYPWNCWAWYSYKTKIFDINNVLLQIKYIYWF